MRKFSFTSNKNILIFQRGGANTGILFIVAIMATLMSFGFLLVGGSFPTTPEPTINAPGNLGKQEIVFNQNTDPGKKNLQLQTFTVKNTCEDKIAVDFLLDVSGSMANNNKIGKEKAALRAFTNRMTDSSVIGMQIFSKPSIVREVVPISLYKDVKSQVQNAITALPADGATSTRSGFALAYQKLSEVINQNKFPGYKYSLVFISDGIPEAEGLIPNQANCIVTAPYTDSRTNKTTTRCFARIQDPRTPTNIPQEIENLAVDIYSIAITDSIDQPMKAELLQLLKDVATDPDSEYFHESVDGNDLTAVLDSVLKSICSTP